MRIAAIATIFSALVLAMGGCGSSGPTAAVSGPTYPASSDLLEVETQASSTYRSATLRVPEESAFVFTALYYCTITRLSYTPYAGRLCGRGYSPTYELFTCRSDATGKGTVLPKAYPVFPRWSPDGSSILFERSERLYIWDLAGHTLRRIFVPGISSIAGQCWRPGTDEIYFGGTASSQSDIYMLSLSNPADTLTKITDDATADRLPTMSPDGKAIAWVRRLGDDEIVMMPVGGDPTTDIVTLTDNSVTDTTPCWSPDGRYIAYLTYDGSHYQCAVYDTVDGQCRQLTDESASVSAPGWSPEGRYVLYSKSGVLYRKLPNASTSDPAEQLATNWGLYPDGFAPSTARWRVLVGSSTQDWAGNDPPFGAQVPGAIIAYSPSKLGVAVSFLIDGEDPLILRDRTPPGASAVVCEAVAARVKRIYQDNGPGVACTSVGFGIGGKHPGSVFLTFDASSAQLTSVVPVYESASTSAASGSRVILRDGKLVFSGAPMQVYDGQGKLLTEDDTVWCVELDAETGCPVSFAHSWPIEAR